MAKRLLLDPEGIGQRLRIRYRNQRRHWLAGGGEWPIRESLGIPTQQQANELLAQVRAWQACWANWNGTAELAWVERRWSALGKQRVPEALVLDSADAVAAFIGKEKEWSLACHRYQEINRRWPALAERLPGYFNVLAEWDEVEFKRLIQVLHWSESNPCSDLYIRQLPIPGVDSKWLEGHQRLLCDWLQPILEIEHDGDFYALTGLRRLPVTLRFRLLDPVLRAQMVGIGDIQAPVSELVSLQLPIERVFIVENLQTGLAFEEIPGTIVFMKQGYAVELFAELNWLTKVPCYYWGDLDTHGFAILNRLRHHLPKVRSLLMDAETLMLHRKLWEYEEKPADAELDRLIPEEKALFDGLRKNQWGVGVRLEQERIDWGYAVEKIQAVL